MKKIKDTKQQLFENMAKLNPDFNEVYDIGAYGENSVEFKAIADELKKTIDSLYNNGEYDILSTLHRLLVGKKINVSAKT